MIEVIDNFLSPFQGEIALIYSGSTYFMMGLIWLIQLVHYPSYRYIGEKEFFSFQQFHVQTITLIVGPVMILELMSLVFLLIQNWGIHLWWQFFMTLGIWISTIVFSIPCHEQLKTKKDFHLIKRLIQTNWPRTILWTGKSILWSVRDL